MGQYLNETHSLAGRRPARLPHITHEQLVCFFQASNGMSRMNRVFAVYSRYSGIHAHIHQLNHRFMGTLAGVFSIRRIWMLCLQGISFYSSMCGATNDGCSFQPIKYLFKLVTRSRIG